MIEPRTCLLVVHLVGLVLGLGVTLLLDLHMLRLLRGHPVGATEAGLVRSGCFLVGIGLALLWLSGIGLVWLATAADPMALHNPKLQAKVAAVVLLTVNGIALHRRVLPRLARNLGRPLFAGLSPGQTMLCLGHGAVSIAGWGFAFVLGAVRELNFAAGLHQFLAVYVAMLAAAGMAALLLYRPGDHAADPDLVRDRDGPATA